MKAVEYFEKHKILLCLVTVTEVEAEVFSILNEFNHETMDIVNKRHVSRNEAVVSVVREQNQKWNAVVRLFEKENPLVPIRKDVYLRFWEHKIPGIGGGKAVND